MQAQAYTAAVSEPAYTAALVHTAAVSELAQGPGYTVAAARTAEQVHTAAAAVHMWAAAAGNPAFSRQIPSVLHPRLLYILFSPLCFDNYRM